MFGVWRSGRLSVGSMPEMGADCQCLHVRSSSGDPFEATIVFVHQKHIETIQEHRQMPEGSPGGSGMPGGAPGAGKWPGAQF